MKKILSIFALILMFAAAESAYATLIPYTSQERPELGEMYKVTQEVKKGWNLIPAFNMNYDLSGYDRGSVPKSEYKARGPISFDSEIQKENIQALFYYSANQNKYLNFWPNVNEAWDGIGKDVYALGIDPNNEQDTKIHNYLLTSGMWLYSNKDGILKYEMFAGQMKELMNKRKLLKGWNFVVVTPDMGTKTFEEIVGTCKIEKSYYYDSVDTKQWISFPVDRIKDATGIVWVVKVSNNCQLGTSGSVPVAPLPQLPN
ncbi:MAG: hypothetical protein LiPW30_510 [Parcubacteria group bacterium LiPW_30]|nr:MAG: hypothetical protein LiPW30_510 [Parcubacteria group bacterium LiPW_30]